MNVELTGRVDNHVYNAADDTFAMDDSAYTFTVSVDDDKDSEDMADKLDSLVDIGDIYYSDFDDTEWGFSTEAQEWHFHIPADSIPAGMTPVEHVTDLLA